MHIIFVTLLHIALTYTKEVYERFRIITKYRIIIILSRTTK